MGLAFRQNSVELCTAASLREYPLASVGVPMHYNFWRDERIRLRALAERDFDTLLRLGDEPDSELERADDTIMLPRSQESRRAELEALVRKERGDDSCFLLIETLADELIGNIATFDCDRRVGAFKYSIVLGRAFWGRGYAREAITILLRYYFRELRYQKVTVLVYSFNARSLRFHERFGFVREGRLRRVVYTNDAYYDECYFGLTAEEFDAIDLKGELPDAAPDAGA